MIDYEHLKRNAECSTFLSNTKSRKLPLSAKMDLSNLQRGELTIGTHYLCTYIYAKKKSFKFLTDFCFSLFGKYVSVCH